MPISVMVSVWKARREGSLALRILAAVGASLLMLGSAGFICSGIAASGGMSFIPSRYELPMGWVSDAVQDSHGRYYCPKTETGRIQVYDEHRRFLHGWFVEASGGTFQLQIDSQDRLLVATARGRRLYWYDSEGILLSSGTYAPRAYKDYDNYYRFPIYIHTPVYLLPFSSVVLAWTIGAIGMLVMGLSLKRLEKRSLRSGCSDS